MDRKSHWENVYRTKRADEVSWFQNQPTLSLDFIRRIAVDKATPLVGTALVEARQRLGERAGQVQWRPDCDLCGRWSLELQRFTRRTILGRVAAPGM
jgi:hypothetical protein